MAGEDARLKAGLKSAEDELNLIKNQIQQTLLDIREHILDVTNPFNSVVPEKLDDDEEMSIEEIGGGAGGGDVVDGGGGSEEVIEGGAEMEEDLESMDDGMGAGDDSLIAGDDGLGDEYEDVPEDDYLGDGGGSSGGGGGGGGGGMTEMLEAAPQQEDDSSEGFELDDDGEEDDFGQTSGFEADIEEEEQMEPVLPSNDLPGQPGDELTSSGDGVADAVAAALAADVDLLTMASLVRWTAVTRERIGANRLDILLDAYELAGRISPQMKNVVRTLSMLGDEDADGIPVRDVVTAMVRMEGVLNSDESRQSNRLLGLLLDMDDDPLDRMAS